jgi:hypothetical protein
MLYPFSEIWVLTSLVLSYTAEVCVSRVGVLWMHFSTLLLI